MEISYLVLKPHISVLEKNLRALQDQVERHGSLEASAIRSEVAGKIAQLEALKASAAAVAIGGEDFTGAFRDLKISYRLAYRRFKKLISNEARIKKFHERRIHVSTFAA